jgi:hypothetical protein
MQKLLILVATVLVACASSEKPPQTAQADCKPGQFKLYSKPGCGPDVPFECSDTPPPPCAGVYCGCDGKTFSSFCGAAERPFAKAGCQDAPPQR